MSYNVNKMAQDQARFLDRETKENMVRSHMKGKGRTYVYWELNCVWRSSLTHTQRGRWMDRWTAVDARLHRTSRRWKIPDIPWAKFTYSLKKKKRPKNCLWHSSVSLANAYNYITAVTLQERNGSMTSKFPSAPLKLTPLHPQLTLPEDQ